MNDSNLDLNCLFHRQTIVRIAHREFQLVKVDRLWARDNPLPHTNRMKRQNVFRIRNIDSSLTSENNVEGEGEIIIIVLIECKSKRKEKTSKYLFV